MEKFESLFEVVNHLRAEVDRLIYREAKAIQMLKQSVISEDDCPKTLLEWITAAYDEIARLRSELQKYHDAMCYPGTDQRHIGTSIATQLVHAQIMREKAEQELEKLKRNLFISDRERKYAESKGWSDVADLMNNRASNMELPESVPEFVPESVDWPSRGRANRQQPRGMSDYERGAGMAGSANYVTEDGAMLRLRDGVRWQAQYKNYTTKWKATAEEAIQELENRNVES